MALHWTDGFAGRGLLLVGDSLTVVMDRRYVSFMYSYPNLIPLSSDSVRRIAASDSLYIRNLLQKGL